MIVRLAVALALTALASGCIGPQVSDEPGPSGEVLPAGATVLSIDDADPAAAAEVAEYDGVDRLVPLETAFSDGGVVHVWDFGVAPAIAAPLYVLVREPSEGVYERIQHPTIAGALPGDPGYSPFWAIFYVVVTDRYAGEQITSLDGLAEAERLGLIEPPEDQRFGVNCPVVASDVTVDVGGGIARAPNAHLYYEGFRVAYFDFGVMPLTDGVQVPIATRYLLRREGGEPLNERVRGVDITGDGDTNDSNDIYAEVPGQATSSPLVSTTSVAVVASTSSIDTSLDETMAALRGADQLFAPGPVAGVVVGFSAGTELRNMPGQHDVGGL